jgi:hypothetical protein
VTPLLAEWESRQLPESASRFSITNFAANSNKIGTTQNGVKGTNAKRISAKIPENAPHCHVPLIAWKIAVRTAQPRLILKVQKPVKVPL